MSRSRSRSPRSADGVGLGGGHDTLAVDVYFDPIAGGAPYVAARLYDAACEAPVGGSSVDVSSHFFGKYRGVEVEVKKYHEWDGRNWTVLRILGEGYHPSWKGADGKPEARLCKKAEVSFSSNGYPFLHGGCEITILPPMAKYYALEGDTFHPQRGGRFIIQRYMIKTVTSPSYEASYPPGHIGGKDLRGRDCWVLEGEDARHP